MSTIFLAGIFGVGKSTLGSKVSDQTGIPFYSAGDLISHINGEQYGANKLVANKNKNQTILIDAVTQLLRGTEHILLAGHFYIINKEGELDKLPEIVFEKLEIEKIILIEADCHSIISNLIERDKKEYSVELIQDLMLQEHQAAILMAERLSCPLVIHHMKYSNEDVLEVAAELKQLN